MSEVSSLPFGSDWPESLASLSSIERFRPASIDFAKRAAKRLRQKMLEKDGVKLTLSGSQQLLALAFGFQDWHELAGDFDRPGWSPSELDDTCSTEIRQARQWQQIAAICEHAHVQGFRAYLVAQSVLLTASPALRAQAREADSPWGLVYDEELIAPGIRQVHTGSHGGILVSSERQAQMPPHLRLEGNAYEEDSDWALVCLAFPQFFDIETLGSALAKRFALDSLSVPHLRQASDSKLELFLKENLGGYVPPDQDTCNREMTSGEVAVIEYLTECAHLNRRPCIFPVSDGDGGAPSLQAWVGALMSVGAARDSWKISEHPWCDPEQEEIGVMGFSRPNNTTSLFRWSPAEHPDWVPSERGNLPLPF